MSSFSKRGVWMNKNAYPYLIVFTHLKRIHKKLIKWITCRACAKTLQSCLTLCDPMDCSLSGSPVHGIFQAWILEWVAISFSRGSSQPKDRTGVSYISYIQFSSVQSLSHVRLFATPWTAAHQASLSITNSQSLLKLMSIESVMPSNHLILCRPLLPPSIFPSIRVVSNESVLHIRWPQYWSFSFSISPSHEYLRLISFRIDRLDLLAIQGTLKSLLQHHSSKTSTLRHSAFFTIQLSHPYMTTGKTIALTGRTFVDKVICLCICCLGWS